MRQFYAMRVRTKKLSSEIVNGVSMRQFYAMRVRPNVSVIDLLNICFNASILRDACKIVMELNRVNRLVSMRQFYAMRVSRKSFINSTRNRSFNASILRDACKRR